MKSRIIIFIPLLIMSISIFAASNFSALKNLQRAYPDFIREINNDALICSDGERINLSADTSISPLLLDQLTQPIYPSNKMIQCASYIPLSDPGRIRNEYFFAKMYGRDKAQVKSHLVVVYWMPKFFGEKYPLHITQVNGVDKKLKQISNQLELLLEAHPDYMKYLAAPSGAFYWRHIENSDRRSPHSFGIAIDINADIANYWIWDTDIKVNKLNQTDQITYKNTIPCEIVSIFENNGFIWGGKWQHYDTMHFEYRPELLFPSSNVTDTKNIN